MKIKYPAWFPYPRCWLRAIVLNIAWTIVGLVGVLFFIVTAPAVGISGSILNAGNQDPSLLLLVWLLILGVVIPVFVLSFVDRIIWNRPREGKDFTPKLTSWLEGIFAYGVSMVLIIFLVLISLGILCDFEAEYCNDMPEEWEVILGIVFTILMAYVYQARFLIVRQWQKENQPEPSRQTLRSRSTSARSQSQTRRSTTQPPRPSRKPQKSPPPKPPSRRDRVADEVTKMREDLTEKRQIDEEIEWLKREMEDKNKPS